MSDTGARYDNYDIAVFGKSEIYCEFHYNSNLFRVAIGDDIKLLQQLYGDCG